MKTQRLLIAASLLLLALFVLANCGSPSPVPPTPPPPISPRDTTTPFVVSTPSVTLPSLDLPTLTPTPQPTPLPTKPRPGYTPVPDSVISPVVIERSPLAGETAKPDGTIQLVFDRAMDHSAVESAFQIYPATKGTINWIDDKTLVFTPAEKLARAGIYDVVLDQRARDAQGAPLNQAYQFRFATAGFLEVAQVIPAPSTNDAEPGSTITVMFNRPVVPLTNLAAQQDFPQPVTISANDQPLDGKGEWLNTSIYVFTPAQPLPGGTIITAKVAATVKDTDGNPMAADYTWQFAVQPPKVVYITPNNGTAQVPIESPVVVQFNQPISLDSAREHVSLTSVSGQSVPLNFDVVSDTLTLTPTNRLDYETAYMIKITAGLTGRSGGSGMRETVNALFTTVPLPKIVSTEPKDGQRDAYPYTSFTIHFNTTMDHSTVMDHLTFNPPLSPTQVYTYGYGDTFGLNFGAQPSTDYEVKITPGIKDPYGNETKEALTVHFRTADLDPSVEIHVPNFIGTYNAYDPAQVYVVNTNIKTLNAQLYRLNADQFVTIQNFAYDNAAPPGTVIRQWSQSVEAPLNKIQATRLDMTADGKPLAPGLYMLQVNSPELKPDAGQYNRRHVLVVSTLNLTLKTTATSALVWATDYRSGQPVPNVPLTFSGYNNVVAGNATTDAQGLATINTNSSNGVTGVVAAEPFAAAWADWSGGISQYDFGLSGNYSSNDQYRGYLYTDRPIYRPGQSVKFKGVIRAENDVKFSLLNINNVHVVINSPNGETVFDQQLPVNQLGTFAGEVKLADSAALGQYFVNVEANQFSFGAAFTAAAYRAPEFQVNVTPKDKEIVRGTSTSASVAVTYYFGGGVANRPVQWNLLADDFNFTPPWGGNYRWTDSDDPWRCFDCWWFSRPTPPQQPILSGSGTTDAQGNLTVELPADLVQNGAPISQSVQLTLEATVTGTDNQVISGRGSLIRHSGDFYVGVQTRAYVGEENKPSTIDLIAVDWQGNRLPNKSLEVSVVRREWDNKFVPNEFGGGDWQYQQKDIAITTSTVTTNDKGEATFDYTPPQAGSYKITVKGVDASNHEIRASVFQWVTGQEFVSWRRENNDRISLISDKSSYVPGETAKILIPSPFQGEHWALITIERGGILQKQLVKITSNSQIFELPITSDLAPNVYVSVVLIKGQDATNKLSDYKVGLLPIEVKPIVQTLRITLTPDKTTAQPGNSVTYNVQVADSSGAAIQAEFSLDLVDKAVLSLLPRSPDEIVNAFYGNRGLGVNTSSGLSVSVNKFNEQLKIDQEQLKAMQQQSLATGAAAPGAPMALPAAPAATAAPAAGERAFAADGLAKNSAAQPAPNIEIRQELRTPHIGIRISTDANGQASVTIKLPDNLTTWTFRGVGLTRDTKVGDATIDVVATKPLLVRPVTPRFFVVGDKAQLSANVSNNTDTPLSVTLTLSSTGVTLLSDALQIVQIPAKTEGSATWLVEAQDVPNVQLVFIAQSGDYVDASKPRLATGPDGSLLVYRYTAPDIVGTAGQIKDGGSRTEIVGLPSNVDVTKGDVSIEIDPSLAAGMINGLDYLEHYPYECAEQTVSRFLPNVLTYRALKQLGIENAKLSAKLPGLVTDGLNRLYGQQKDDGGWGWWVDSQSNPYLTAYVVFGMIEARNAGFDVRADVVQRGEQYVINNLSSKPSELSNWQANQQAWFLFVLNEDNQAPADKLNALFAERGKLSHFAKAYLAMVYGKGSDQTRTLLSDLNNAAILSSTGAHWEEANYDWWSMNTDTRSTGIILSAYARLDPGNALAPNIVRWLMVARKVGHWETTQETAWALIGLTDWMKVTGELKPNYDYALFLNDKSISEGTITADKVQQPIELSIAIKDLMIDQANRLTFSRGAGDGVMYYTAHLSVYQPVEALKPVDRGVTVSRRYTLASCTETDRTKCPEVTAAKLGDVIRVDLTIVAPNDLYYLVVDDPLPAGAEAIDRGLATTSMLDQDPTLIRQPITSPDGKASYSPWWWWWNWYSRSELRDEKVVLFADYLGKGTYEYSYTMRATLPGDYKVIPTVASEFYFPEVFGRSDGRLLSIGK